MSTEIIKKIENFGDRLRTARKAKALGQVELAAKIGVSGGSVGNWEVGPSQPRPEALRKLAAILEVTPAWLIYGDPPPEQKPPGENDPMRKKCRDYFEAFMHKCQTHAQLGWLYYELTERFPLQRFGAAEAEASSAPASSDEQILSALEQAQPAAVPSRRRKR
jgi:transcriptional regulator with XRE-family HTH domain